MRGVIIAAVLLLCGVAHAQIESDDGMLQVRQENGGSVAVRTAGGTLNQDSSLQRRWYIINDANSPVRLERAGVFPRFDEREGVHYFLPIGTVSPKDAISAIEVRYLLFDIWGEHLRTFSVTKITDSSTHVDLQAGNRWPALETEASQLVSVFAFVTRVRATDGQTWTYNADRMLQRMQALGVNVGQKDLLADDPWMGNAEIFRWLRILARGDASAKGGGVQR